MINGSRSGVLDSVFDRAGLAVIERGWLSSNNILFAGDEHNGPVLVDSGYSSHSEQTVLLVKRMLGGSLLQRVVNTHLHSDHCGGNFALQSAFNCTIDIPRGSASTVDGWLEDRLTYRATGQVCPRFVRDGLLHDGGLARLGSHDWQVIATPGHDQESLVYYQPEFRILISADALWEDGFGVVFDELQCIPAFDKTRRTLDRLSSLEVDWIIPGHGRPFQGLAEAICKAQRRLEAFEANPKRHARYAAKVLIKFHLLEHEMVQLVDLQKWLESTEYFRITHRLHFGTTSFDDWWLLLLDDLGKSGALISDGSVVRNV